MWTLYIRTDRPCESTLHFLWTGRIKKGLKHLYAANCMDLYERQEASRRLRP